MFGQRCGTGRSVQTAKGTAMIVHLANLDFEALFCTVTSSLTDPVMTVIQHVGVAGNARLQIFESCGLI